MRIWGLVAMLALAGCKERATPAGPVMTDGSTTSETASSTPDASDQDEIVELDAKLLSKVCAMLTDAPAVAEICGPLPWDAGPTSGTLNYRFKKSKTATVEASGGLIQFRSGAHFDAARAKFASTGEHHCENEAHHIMILFVGQPDETAEMGACMRLKSIP